MKKEVKKETKKVVKKLNIKSLMDKFGNMAVMGGILSISKTTDKLVSMAKVQTIMIALTMGLVIGHIIFK